MKKVVSRSQKIKKLTKVEGAYDTQNFEGHEKGMITENFDKYLRELRNENKPISPSERSEADSIVTGYFDELIKIFEKKNKNRTFKNYLLTPLIKCPMD